MTKVVFPILGLISLLGGLAQASVTCVNKKDARTISLELIETGDVIVSMYGHSRNTYWALYERTRPSDTPTLKKVLDRSTHQDMPEQLGLLNYHLKAEPGEFYELLGLPVAGPVRFNQMTDCYSN